MDYAQFKDLVLRRQSCRNFSGKLVEKEKITMLCEVARLTPSACNSQPWKIYGVSSQEKIDLITQSLQDNGRNAFLSKAGGYIVVSGTKARLLKDVVHKYDEMHFVKYDVGQTLAYITLCAESMGLASCLIGYINQEKLRSACGMEDGEECNVVVALGYSDIPVREKSRKPYQSVVKEL